MRKIMGKIETGRSILARMLLFTMITMETGSYSWESGSFFPDIWDERDRRQEKIAA